MSLNFDPSYPGQYGSFPSGNINFDNLGVYLEPTGPTTADVYILSDVLISDFWLVFKTASIKTLDGFTLDVPGGDPLSFAVITGPPTSADPHHIRFEYTPGFGNWGGPNPVWMKIGEIQFTLEPGITEIALENNVSYGTRAYNNNQQPVVTSYANIASPSNHSFETSWTMPAPEPLAVISQPTGNLTLTSGETVLFEGENSLLANGSRYVDSSPSSLSFLWTFSDGQTSTDPNPVVTFPPGTWGGDTTLTVTGDGGVQNTTHISGQTYTVNPPQDHSLSATAQLNSNGDFEWTITPGTDLHHVHVDIEVNGVTHSDMVYPASPGAVTVHTILRSTLSHLYGSFNWTVAGKDSGHSPLGTPVTGQINISAPAADVTSPVINLTGPNPQPLAYGATWTEPGYTATDDVDGDVTSAVVTMITDPSGNGVSTLDGNLSGTHTVTYTVSDTSGNTATATRTVQVAAADLSLVVNDCSVDSNDVPSVTIAWGANVFSYYFSLTNDADGSEYFGTLNNDTTGDTSPHTSTGSNNLPAGNYSWTIVGTGDAGQNITGNSGSLSLTAPLGFHSVATTADALPWSMANVRWGISTGAVVPTGTYVQVERKQGLNGAWTVISSNQPPESGGLNGSTGTGFHDSGLAPDTTYFYRLIFVDTNGTVGSHSTELEYATIAIPLFATADVNTRGVVHPIIAVTGTGITQWYWTTESVTNPELRTKADWEADANAYRVDNHSGGVTASIMSHLGPGTGNPSGNHLPGAYTVTVCGFWADGVPLTSDMNNTSLTTNTVHVIPYNVYSGLISAGASQTALGSDWVYSLDVGKPNDAYDWHGIRYELTTTSPGLYAGDPAGAWGSSASVNVSGEAEIRQALSPSGPDQWTIHVIPVTDEGDEAAPNNGGYAISGHTPKGVGSIVATVTGNNLSETDNVSFLISPVSGIFSPTNIIRVGDTAPPVSGGIGGWGTEVALSSGSTITVTQNIKTPGMGILYAQACFPDGTAIGAMVSASYTINQSPYTGLSDLKFSRNNDGDLVLEAYGYFPQWRYYLGVLPHSTAQGADMTTDPNGVAITGNVQTPTTLPSTVGIEVETNQRLVVVGLATDGTHLVGKPLIRAIYIPTRTAEEESAVRATAAPDTFDPTNIVVGGIYGKTLDSDGNRTKVTLSGSVEKLAQTIDGWAANGLTSADLTNLLVRPTGSLREFSTISAYVVPATSVAIAVTGTDSNGNNTYENQSVYPKWITNDGSANMGIDFSAEIVADFANVDNSIAALVSATGNGVTDIKTLTLATAGVDLTTTGTGTVAWPIEFVRERLGQVRQKGLISKEDAESFVHGKREVFLTDENGVSVSMGVHKRGDLKDWYPSFDGSLAEDNSWTKQSARDQGAAQISARGAYEASLTRPKIRSAGLVAADDYFKKPPVFTVHVTTRPDTSSPRSLPLSAAGDLTLDRINDRPNHGSTAHNSFTQTATTAGGLLAELASVSTPILSPGVITHALTSDPYQLSVGPIEDTAGRDRDLFMDWYDRSDADVPMEILNRFLEFGNAVTESSLQELYDLEKTGDTTVLGSGRNRTEWKTAIADYSTLIGVSINL